jgi:hypothetical protein
VLGEISTALKHLLASEPTPPSDSTGLDWAQIAARDPTYLPVTKIHPEWENCTAPHSSLAIIQLTWLPALLNRPGFGPPPPVGLQRVLIGNRSIVVAVGGTLLARHLVTHTPEDLWLIVLRRLRHPAQPGGQL